MVVRRAALSEISLLTDLCFSSKASWGYSAAFMEACRHELMVSQEDFVRDQIIVFEELDQILGFAQLAVQGERAELVKLFVLPFAMRGRRGGPVGTALFSFVVNEAMSAGAGGLKIISDPYAVGFYKKMGAVEVGVELSETWPDRYLPVLFLSFG